MPGPLIFNGFPRLGPAITALEACIGRLSLAIMAEADVAAATAPERAADAGLSSFWDSWIYLAGNHGGRGLHGLCGRR